MRLGFPTQSERFPVQDMAALTRAGQLPMGRADPAGRCDARSMSNGRGSTSCNRLI